VGGFERLGDLPRDRHDLGNGQATASVACRSCQALRESVAFDQFEHQPRNTVDILEAVDCADVGVIERREHARFPFEPGETFGVAREEPRQDLDCDFPAKFAVPCSIHLL
jgi:hypothetical protein